MKLTKLCTQYKCGDVRIDTMPESVLCVRGTQRRIERDISLFHINPKFLGVYLAYFIFDEVFQIRVRNISNYFMKLLIMINYLRKVPFKL